MYPRTAAEALRAGGRAESGLMRDFNHGGCYPWYLTSLHELLMKKIHILALALSTSLLAAASVVAVGCKGSTRIVKFV